MAWADHIAYQPPIEAPPESVHPLGDFVLVKPFPPEDPIMQISPIINPGVHMTKDYRWRSDRPRGGRFGKVVAAGPGDRLLEMVCPKCHGGEEFPPTKFLLEASKRKCLNCGGILTPVTFEGHILKACAPMYVKPGDIVFYERCPANEIILNGEEHVFLHHEQHILAVIEQGAA